MRLARGIMTLLRAAEQSEMNKSLPWWQDGKDMLESTTYSGTATLHYEAYVPQSGKEALIDDDVHLHLFVCLFVADRAYVRLAWMKTAKPPINVNI